MGATNPANAAAGTIRKEFAESIEANSRARLRQRRERRHRDRPILRGAEIVG
jgi:nucleoside diphosphate kinase